MLDYVYDVIIVIIIISQINSYDMIKLFLYYDMKLFYELPTSRQETPSCCSIGLIEATEAITLVACCL